MFLVTYNCCDFTDSKIVYIKQLYSDADILFLQELWIYDAQRSRLNDIFSECNVFSCSTIKSTTFLPGRPYGGCGILIKI